MDLSCHLQLSIAAQPSGELCRQLSSKKEAKQTAGDTTEKQQQLPELFREAGLDARTCHSLLLQKEGGKRRKGRRRKGARQLRNPIIAAGAGPLTNSGHLVNNNNNNKLDDHPGWSLHSTFGRDKRDKKDQKDTSMEQPPRTLLTKVEGMTTTTHSMCKVNNQTSPIFCFGTLFSGSFAVVFSLWMPVDVFSCHFLSSHRLGFWDALAASPWSDHSGPSLPARQSPSRPPPLLRSGGITRPVCAYFHQS